MNYIYCDNQSPVNLNKVDYITYSPEGWTETYIRFYVPGGWKQWDFKTKEERNIIREKLLSIKGMTNISNINVSL